MQWAIVSWQVMEVKLTLISTVGRERLAGVATKWCPPREQITGVTAWLQEGVHNSNHTINRGKKAQKINPNAVSRTDPRLNCTATLSMYMWQALNQPSQSWSGLARNVHWVALYTFPKVQLKGLYCWLADGWCAHGLRTHTTHDLYSLVITRTAGPCWHFKAV